MFPIQSLTLIATLAGALAVLAVPASAAAGAGCGAGRSHASPTGERDRHVGELMQLHGFASGPQGVRRAAPGLAGTCCREASGQTATVKP